MRLDELDLHGMDAMKAMAMAAAFVSLGEGEDASVLGGALGIALGEWLAKLSHDPKVQEAALDRILVLTAKASAVNAQ